MPRIVHDRCLLKLRVNDTMSDLRVYYPFKYEAQTALFEDPVRTAQ
jgi:hypothetical protein